MDRAKIPLTAPSDLTSISSSSQNNPFIFISSNSYGRIFLCFVNLVASWDCTFGSEMCSLDCVLWMVFLFWSLVYYSFLFPSVVSFIWSQIWYHEEEAWHPFSCCKCFFFFYNKLFLIFLILVIISFYLWLVLWCVVWVSSKNHRKWRKIFPL